MFEHGELSGFCIQNTGDVSEIHNVDTIYRSKNHSLQHVFERGEDLALHMEKSIVFGSVTGEPHHWYSIYIN